MSLNPSTRGSSGKRSVRRGLLHQEIPWICGYIEKKKAKLISLQHGQISRGTNVPFREFFSIFYPTTDRKRSTPRVTMDWGKEIWERQNSSCPCDGGQPVSKEFKHTNERKRSSGIGPSAPLIPGRVNALGYDCRVAATPQPSCSCIATPKATVPALVDEFLTLQNWRPLQYLA
jgi:hypothetical protein